MWVWPWKIFHVLQWTADCLFQETVVKCYTLVGILNHIHEINQLWVETNDLHFTVTCTTTFEPPPLHIILLTLSLTCYLHPCRCELLHEWKSSNGSRATYRALLEACVKTDNADAANSIVTLLCGKIILFFNKYSFILLLCNSQLHKIVLCLWFLQQTLFNLISVS